MPGRLSGCDESSATVPQAFGMVPTTLPCSSNRNRPNGHQFRIQPYCTAGSGPCSFSLFPSCKYACPSPMVPYRWILQHFLLLLHLSSVLWLQCCQSKERVFANNGNCPPVAETITTSSRFVLFFFLLIPCYSNSFHASWQLDDKPNITEQSKLHIDNLMPSSVWNTFFAKPGDYGCTIPADFKPQFCPELVSWERSIRLDTMSSTSRFT